MVTSKNLLDRALAFIEEPGNYSDEERSKLLNDLAEAIDDNDPCYHWE